MADRKAIAIALGQIEHELRAELPLHMRAFARAHADGRTPPAAPLVARLESTLETAIAACAHENLFERGLALLRLVAPIAIEDDPDVAVARRHAPSWSGLVELSRARDAAARARFGISAIAVFHALHGTPEPPVELDAVHPGDPGDPAASLTRQKSLTKEVAAKIDGWRTRGPAFDPTSVQDVWTAIAGRLDLAGSVRIDRTVTARPRTFVIEPRHEVIVVAAAVIDTPAARFELLHELGHAVAALMLDAGVPRVIDEAVAAYLSRLLEPPSWLPTRWTSELAAPARERRVAIAATFDRVERALPELPDRPGLTPPWALWHDPGSSASYVAAEAIADRLRRDLGPNPPRGQFARALAAERDQIDHRTRI